MNICANCGDDTANPKFCSRSCSASMTNRTTPKRRKSRVCKAETCDTKIVSGRTYCTDHWQSGTKYRTIGEIRANAKYQVNAYARYLAREWAKKNMDTSKCMRCDYTNHVEVAHIIPIASFPDETPIADTYDGNLLILCPNHHWEFDNGHLLYERQAGFEPAFPPITL